MPNVNWDRRPRLVFFRKFQRHTTTSAMVTITEVSVDASGKLESSSLFFQRGRTMPCMLFGDKLRGLAKLRRWSISQVAKAAGIAQQTLSSALNGHGTQVKFAIKIAQAMGVPVEWLFDDSKDWKDLSSRPWWLEPGIDPENELQAMERLTGSLRQGPPGRPSRPVRKQSEKSDRPAKSARKAAEGEQRHKSGA